MATRLAVAAGLIGLVLVAQEAEDRRAAALRDEARALEAERGALEVVHLRRLREEEAVDALAGRLVAGSLPLPAAVDEIEPVLRQRVGFEVDRSGDPPPSFRHRVARYLVNRAGNLMGPESDRRAAVLARLDAEYAALRGADGGK